MEPDLLEPQAKHLPGALRGESASLGVRVEAPADLPLTALEALSWSMNSPTVRPVGLTAARMGGSPSPRDRLAPRCSSLARAWSTSIGVHGR
jgi:hypothetical protein